MKKIVVFILTLLLPVVQYGQNKDLQKIYAQLDSLIKRESYYFPKTHNTAYVFFSFYERHPEYNKYAMEIIKYMERYMHDSLYNVMEISTSVIAEVGLESEKRRIRRRALNDLLDMAVIMPSTWYDILRFDLKDFDRRAKRRLKEVLLGKKTDYEVSVWYEYKKREWLQDSYFQSKVNEIVERDSLPREYVVDSLLKEFINLEDIKKSGVYEKLYLLPGWLYMYDFKPELEAMLKERRRVHSRFPIKLSLARLGEREYEEQILKNEKNWKWVFYINTQSAYSWLVDYMNRTDETVSCDWDDTGFAPLSQVIYYSITRRIKNFPSEYRIKEPIKGSHCGFTKGELEKFEKGKAWLEQHKGHYKLEK